MGLTITQMLDLLGLKQSQRNVFSAGEDRLDPAWVSTAETLRDFYRRWREFILGKLDKSVTYTSHDLSKILDIDRFNLLQMMKRGYIRSDQFYGRQHLFTAATIMGLVDYNSEHMLAGVGTNTRGPLAESFIRWLKPQWPPEAEVDSSQEPEREAVAV